MSCDARVMLVLVLVLAIALGTLAVPFATTADPYVELYVATTGSDLVNCTAAAPCASLHRAFALLTKNTNTTIWVDAGTYTLDNSSFAFPGSADVAVRSRGGSVQLTCSKPAADMLWGFANPGRLFTLEGLHVSQCNIVAAGIGLSNMLIQNCRLTHNKGGDSFAAVSVAAGSKLWVHDSHFESNTATPMLDFSPDTTGGAISIDNLGEAYIAGSTFILNEATYGGAIGLANLATATIDSCVFQLNIADKAGGAIVVNTGSSAQFTTSLKCTSNVVMGGGVGGGIAVMLGSSINLPDPDNGAFFVADNLEDNIDCSGAKSGSVCNSCGSCNGKAGFCRAGGCVCNAKHFVGPSCHECAPHWAPTGTCQSCAHDLISGFWQGQNCDQCYPHFTLESGCQVCEQGYAFDGVFMRCDPVVPTPTPSPAGPGRGGDTSAVIIGSVIGVAVVGSAVVYAGWRRRRRAAYTQI